MSEPKLRDYWSLPPDEQNALLAHITEPQPPVLRLTVPDPLPTRLPERENRAFMGAEARLLLELRGDYGNMEFRTDDDCIDACELEGYVWHPLTGSWVMEE